MTSLLCFGDLHLGQGANLGQPGERLQEQAQALDEVYLLAKDRQVDGILFAGDAFEGPTIPPEQLDVFAGFVGSCRAARIPIVAITGNGRHDAAMRSTNGMAIFRHIPGITVSSRPDIHEVADVHVATLPWVHPGRYVAMHNGDVARDDINAAAAGLLVEVARGLRAQVPDGDRAVLMLHWSVEGASLPNGLRIDDHAHEPILPVADLEELGFDAVVCSHIHKPQRMEVLMAGPFFYTGSPMPLNFGEASVEHGVWIVDVDDVDTTAEFVPIESRRFVTLDVDITGETETSGLAYIDLGYAELKQPVDGAFVKARYRATREQARRVDHAVLRRAFEDAGAHKVWIQPDIVRDQAVRVDGVDETIDDREALDRWLFPLCADPAVRARVAERHARYLEELSAA